MEDYCLKLIDVDENLSKWAGLKLGELAEHIKQAGWEKIDVHRSSSFLKGLAFKKGIDYRELIDYIISNASNQSLESIISRELRDFLLK
jgi:hypothetical protein